MMYRVAARATCLAAALTAVALCGASGTFAAEVKTPSAAANPATATDPKPDAAHPAGITPVLIPSAGAAMNGVLFTAAGAGPHRTLLLLHGQPGNEQNLDLAYAARRAGWHVLTLHSRGAWGSEGTYSIENTVADTAAAMAFLRDPSNAAKYGIDPKRLAIAGHSVGGYDVARQARVDHQILGVALIDAASAAPNPAAAAPARLKEQTDSFAHGELSHSLKTASPEQVVAEYAHIAVDETIVTFAKDLTGIPVLIVAAEQANGARNKLLAEAIAKYDGSRLQAIVLPTDHSFSGRRIELTNILLNWLDSLK